MEKPILADGVERAAAPAPRLDAEHVSGAVYVIDLIGFSQITEIEIAQSARSGTETVTRLVANLFSKLMQELAAQNIRFGGFAGDALIAWQTDADEALPAPEFEAITLAVCDQVGSGISCRTAIAHGTFWTANVETRQGARPLLWGPAVSAAFATLASKPRRAARSNALTNQGAASHQSIMATASVTDRWTVILRALTPEQCETTLPTQLAALLQRSREVCDAVDADIDNIVQDDKGLLIVIILAASHAQDTNQRDVLLDNLISARAPLAQRHATASEFGTVFRCRPAIAGHTVTITIGKPINRAAKALLHGEDPLPAKAQLPARGIAAKGVLIGREQEVKRLWQAYQSSQTARHVATLTAPAGIGKTTLVQNLAAQVDASIATVEVTPGSRYLPYGCLQDLAEACDLPAETVFQAEGQTNLAQALPPVIIIENWQWCDEDSKRLLRRLHTDRTTGLLLITSREPIADIEAETRLTLAPLDFQQSRQLMDRLAPDLLSEGLKRSIFDVTSGTPFWLVQAALHYADQGPRLNAPASLSGLEGLLTARGHDLSEQATALWRLYCAWRLPLDFDAARALLKRFNITITPEHHSELETLGWIVRDETSDRAGWRPAHDILADWGNSDLPVTFEQALHSAIARRVSKQNGSPPRIARHWQIAGRNLRAAIWFNRAAQDADRAGAHNLTLAHMTQAARLSGAVETHNQVRELEFLALSATANWGIGKLRRAKQLLTAFDDLSKHIPASARKRAALSRTASVQSEVGQFAGNSNLIFTGMYRGWRNSGGAVAAHQVKARRQGFIYYALGMLRLPIDGRLNHLVQMAHDQGNYRNQATLGCAAGTLYMTRCDWRKAEAVLSSCHAAIAQTDDRQLLGTAQCLLGLCDLFQGNTDRAGDWFERVAETGRDQNHHMFKVWGAYAQAEAQFYAGDIRGAKHLSLAARAQSKGLGDHQSACIIEGILAQIYLAEGDYANARRHARNAARFAAKLPPTNFSTLEGIAAPAQVGIELVRIKGADPELETMIKTGRQALKSFAQVFKVAQPRRRYVEGLHARAQGEARSAIRHFKKARSAAVSLGMRYEMRLTTTALDAIKESPNGATTEIY
ncbi:MAG: AAA family ATPase [Pseudomonadota bacterium]